MIPNWTCLHKCKLHLLNITDLIVFDGEIHNDKLAFIEDLGLLQKINMIRYEKFDNHQSNFSEVWEYVKHIMSGFNQHQIRRDKNYMAKYSRKAAKKI